ncbi:unnamed protein product [Amoebophrya sp. A120]|nr:unnamed protein product [Amoebophrya sp. A120]|eukprot:GSA120T00021227001.1
MPAPAPFPRVLLPPALFWLGCIVPLSATATTSFCTLVLKNGSVRQGKSRKFIKNRTPPGPGLPGNIVDLCGSQPFCISPLRSPPHHPLPLACVSYLIMTPVNVLAETSLLSALQSCSSSKIRLYERTTHFNYKHIQTDITHF